MFTGIMQPTHLIILLGHRPHLLGPKRLPEQAERWAKDSESSRPRCRTKPSPHSLKPPPPRADAAGPARRDGPARHEETPPVQ